ncbi:putative histidinol-phosphate transaminase [Tilletiopsis washingtonensis]|uniref:histidinol-phosphate transaminase n=1 Tax=Tilletiopsis washingtonensis TaxID=58919 RepID=A0A316Z6V0_9BASI|nr:putative histidinol-phosphate transaminase [Tilletiopsis washingtonensis]PWN97026.1 putative histidinol-phosphate transaminase [Tilletiopsis washingtonensis]
MTASAIPGLAPQAAAAVAQLKPAHFELERIIRPNILSLAPYRCARDDYQSGILLDANENSLGHSLPGASQASGSGSNGAGAGAASLTASPAAAAAIDALGLNRYPDPSLFGVKPTLARLRGLPSEDHVMLGVGSDEVLDLLQRITCRPGQDKIMICPPTYGMYSVCAAVNDVQVVKVPLKTAGGDFGLDVPQILKTLASTPDIRLLFLCSPGNPTGTLLPLDAVREILEFPDWSGLVVVDEAYIDFAEEELRLGKRAEQPSATSLLSEYKNVVVTQTLSKAFGLAAIRLGICYGSPALIQIINNTKAPYNISVPTAHLASLALSPEGLDLMRSNVRLLMENRDELIAGLKQLQCTGEILGANDANFVLVQVLDKARADGGRPSGERAEMCYKRMAEERGLVVRNRSKELGCAGCLRITVGTKEENAKCLELMAELLG